MTTAMSKSNHSLLSRSMVLALLLAILSALPLARGQEEGEFDTAAVHASLRQSIVRVLIYLPRERPDLEIENTDPYMRYSNNESYSVADARFYTANLGDQRGRSRFDRDLQTLRTERIPIALQGVVVSEDGLILFPDPLLDLKDYESIEIKGLNGVSGEADLVGMPNSFSAVFCKLRNGGKGFQPVEFSPCPALNLGDSYHTASLQQLEDEWMLVTSGGSVSASGNSGNAPLILSRPFGGSLMLDDAGAPFGMILGEYAWRDEKDRLSCDGRAILADERITAEQLRGCDERAKAVTDETVWEVKVKIRVDNDEYSYYGEEDALERLTEHRLYGILLDDKGSLFLPYSFPVATLQSFHKAQVTLPGDEGETEATYVGSFLKFGGLLFDCPALAGKTPAPRKNIDRFTRLQAVYSVKTSYKFGEVATEPRLNRVSQFLIQEATRFDPRREYPLLVSPMVEGEWLFDQSMQMIGFMSTEKIERKNLADASSRYGRFGYGQETTGKYESRSRLFRWAEVADALRDPKDHLDPEAVPKSETEVKRLIWIGVEFQSLDMNLAKYLNVQQPTKNGSKGLLVNVVYDDSPAQRAGLQPGDILLSFTIQGTSRKQDLIDEERYWYYYGGVTRRNYLTNLLKDVGEGKVLELKYLRDGVETGMNITTELAPPDQESAQKFKNKELGITVKTLTYEVRNRLKLPADHQGVVIDNVESGSRVEVAELGWGILEKVNNEAVTSVDDLKNLLMKFKSEGLGRLTFFVRQFDETRFFEVHTGWDE